MRWFIVGLPMCMAIVAFGEAAQKEKEQGDKEKNGPKHVKAVVDCPMSGDGRPPNLLAMGSANVGEIVYAYVVNPDNFGMPHMGETKTPGPAWKIQFKGLPVGSNRLLRVQSVFGPTDGGQVPFDVVNGADNCMEKFASQPAKQMRRTLAKKDRIEITHKITTMGTVTYKGSQKKGTSGPAGLEDKVHGIILPLGVVPPFQTYPCTTTTHGNRWEVRFDLSAIPAGNYRLRVVNLGQTAWDHDDFTLP